MRQEVEEKSKILFNLLFEPESDSPVKTLDLPFGGALSPLDALSVLVELLSITRGEELVIPATGKQPERRKLKDISDYGDDPEGRDTVNTLAKAINVLSRMTSNEAGSLGLHPVVYFYNENGKHSRFLFLAMVTLISERVKFRDDNFFRKFTKGRASLEKFLIENKSLLSIMLQNMSKAQRISNTKDLLYFLVEEFSEGKTVTPESAISKAGMSGRIYDVIANVKSQNFSDDTKSAIFIKTALGGAMKCPVCGGYLDPRKSVSYDHKTRKREGGLGDEGNGQLVHPYCNTGVKN